jgi:hypothetical protein
MTIEQELFQNPWVDRDVSKARYLAQRGRVVRAGESPVLIPPGLSRGSLTFSGWPPRTGRSNEI